MDSFRYPLAGEFSFRRDVLKDIRIPSDWGLEIGVLSEMHRNYANNRLCQVDIAKVYDHKHQDLSLSDQQAGLSKMSIDISKALFRKLATKGTVFNEETFRTIKASYYRIALDFVETYRNDAIMNGLNFDIHQEEKAVEMFAKNIMDGGKRFLDNPMETPFIPSWSRVQSAIPDIFDRLYKAVEEEHHIQYHHIQYHHIQYHHIQYHHIHRHSLNHHHIDQHNLAQQRNFHHNYNFLLHIDKRHHL
jgi:glucosyl-3-phosphoglycerate synthase